MIEIEVQLIQMMLVMTFEAFEKLCIKCGRYPLNEVNSNPLQNFLSVDIFQACDKAC